MNQTTAFTFTKIADNTDQFTDFDTNFAINNSGIVAFEGSLSEPPPEFLGSGSAAIFTGDGNSLIKISDGSNLEDLELPFREFIELDISDEGSVLFSPLGTVGRYYEGQIVVSSDGILTTLINDSGIYGSTYEVSFNNNSTIAFIKADELYGGDLQHLSTISSDGTVTDIANTRLPENDPFINPDSEFVDFGDVDINDSGTVVFTATLVEDNTLVEGDSAILTVEGGTIAPLIDNSSLSSFENAAINNSDTVVFTASLDEGGSGVFTISNDTLTTVADSSGLFDSFEEASINDSGAVAFLASLDAGGEGIFLGSDLVTDKVIATGDSLLGSTVTDLDFSTKSFNDFGQLSGSAELANGTEVIFRADPESEPVNVVNGTNKQNILTGTDGVDEINGFNGKDLLVGLESSDWLNGGKGQDILVGVNPYSDRPGFGEVDQLKGGKGRDYFVLGDSIHVYYKDFNSANSGEADYGLITDFKNDVIVLKGKPSRYVLVENYSVGDRTGTGIFLNNTVDELIGLVQGATDLNLSSNDFSFV